MLIAGIKESEEGTLWSDFRNIKTLRNKILKFVLQLLCNITSSEDIQRRFISRVTKRTQWWWNFSWKVTYRDWEYYSKIFYWNIGRFVSLETFLYKTYISFQFISVLASTLSYLIGEKKRLVKSGQFFSADQYFPRSIISPD